MAFDATVLCRALLNPHGLEFELLVRAAEGVPLRGFATDVVGMEFLRNAYAGFGAGERFQEVADRLAELSQFYIAPRYPDAHPSGGAGEHYTATQAARANELASGVLAWIDEQWELARAQGA